MNSNEYPFFLSSVSFYSFLTTSSVVAVLPVPGIPDMQREELEPPFWIPLIRQSLIQFLSLSRHGSTSGIALSWSEAHTRSYSLSYFLGVIRGAGLVSLAVAVLLPRVFLDLTFEMTSSLSSSSSSIIVVLLAGPLFLPLVGVKLLCDDSLDEDRFLVYGFLRLVVVGTTSPLYISIINSYLSSSLESICLLTPIRLFDVVISSLSLLICCLGGGNLKLSLFLTVRSLSKFSTSQWLESL